MRHHALKYLVFLSFQMPMDLADKINDVDDVDVFIHDFVFEGDTNSLSNMSSLVQHPADRKRKF